MVSEEALGEMLSYFPARDVEEPVTKEFLRAEIADVRAGMGEVRGEIADVRAEIAELRGEMSAVKGFLMVNAGLSVSIGMMVVAANRL